jgi:hypothetical protein
MLYVGNMNGKALKFHDIWSVNVSNEAGGVHKQVIGKSVVSTLNHGRELHLASPSLSERVTAILVFSDGCVDLNRAGPIQKSNGQK